MRHRGVRTAVGDFDGDGVPDVAVGTGPGGRSAVRVLSGVSGAEPIAFAPFEAAFGPGGVFVG